MMNAPPNKNFAWDAAWAALGFHTLAILGFTLAIYMGLSHSDSQVMGWFVWVIIDFPSGALFMFTSIWSFNLGLDRSHPHLCNILFAIQFGLLGGLQYFLFAGWHVAIRRKRLVPVVRAPGASPTEHVTPANLDNPYTAPNAQPSEYQP